VFRDRADAGVRLANRLRGFEPRPDVVIAIPRGGVEVGAPIADELGLPLDVIIVRKLGAPDRPELAIGAVTDAGEPHVELDREIIRGLGVTEDYVRGETQRQVEECRRRERAYRSGRPPLGVEGSIVLLVDDGLATGSTARVAVAGLRQRKARQVMLVVPVAAPGAVASLSATADRVVALEAPAGFQAVGQFYENFDQTSDARVGHLLARAAG